MPKHELLCNIESPLLSRVQYSGHEGIAKLLLKPEDVNLQTLCMTEHASLVLTRRSMREE